MPVAGRNGACSRALHHWSNIDPAGSMCLAGSFAIEGERADPVGGAVNAATTAGPDAPPPGEGGNPAQSRGIGEVRGRRLAEVTQRHVRRTIRTPIFVRLAAEQRRVRSALVAPHREEAAPPCKWAGGGGWPRKPGQQIERADDWRSAGTALFDIQFRRGEFWCPESALRARLTTCDDRRNTGRQVSPSRLTHYCIFGCPHLATDGSR